jgi:hypothetical protein
MPMAIKICTAKQWVTIGEFHGLHEHISIIMKLTNTNLMKIFYIYSNLFARSALSLFPEYITDNTVFFITVSKYSTGVPQ